MAVVTANVDSLAAQAAAVPGSDPATLQRIMSLAKDINAAYSRTDGMNMTAVTTGAGKLLGSGGRSRGGIGGFIYKFLVDIASKIGSDGAFRWFQSIGVSDDEEQRESAETRQRDNALKLHEEVEAACRSIEEIDATANTAIGGLMETISMLLGIVRLHPAGRAAALIMPLVANGFEQVYGIVEDRNQQLEACLNAVAESGRAMQEHQPAPPCEWTCPPASETPCSDAPAPQQPGDAPAPPAQGGTVAASSEDECDEKPTPAAQPAQPTQPAQCAPPAPSEPPAEKCIERLVPAPPLDRMPTHAASAVTESPTNIAFNFHIDSDATWQASSACAPTCDDAAQFAPPKQDFSVCHIGVLAQIGVSITLECLDYLAECISQSAECPGEDCSVHEETPPPAPEPPAPEPPAPEPPAPEPPVTEETPKPPPPDLAAVAEPPAPAEKLRALGLEPQAAPPEPEPAPAPPPAPAPEPPPRGDTPKMRKTGEW